MWINLDALAQRAKNEEGTPQSVVLVVEWDGSGFVYTGGMKRPYDSAGGFETAMVRFNSWRRTEDDPFFDKQEPGKSLQTLNAWSPGCAVASLDDLPISEMKSIASQPTVRGLLRRIVLEDDEEGDA